MLFLITSADLSQSKIALKGYTGHRYCIDSSHLKIGYWKPTKNLTDTPDPIYTVSTETTHFGYQTIPTHEKSERVASVFRLVANRYDLMNDLMSFGLHRFWKRIAVQLCSLKANHYVLDLAGGTGDLTLQFAKIIKKEGKIVLADINDAMLQKGRDKVINAGFVQTVSFMRLNAEALPFADHTFDRLAIAFGLRNITNKQAALQEMHRVLKPGGKAVILEFSHVSSKRLQILYDAYSFSVLPLLGKYVCHDEASYRYLAESIRMHPDQDCLKSMMDKVGFERAEYHNMHSGVVAFHVGYKF